MDNTMDIRLFSTKVLEHRSNVLWQLLRATLSLASWGIYTMGIIDSVPQSPHDIALPELGAHFSIHGKDQGTMPPNAAAK